MEKNKFVQSSENFNKKFRDKWPYFAVITIVIAVLCIIYKEMDINKPLVYSNGDEFGVFYIVKTIKETGWYLFNPRVGGVTGGDLYDYIYSDSLSFFLIRIISLFVDNIYTISNLFYFLNFILASCSSVYVCRKLNIDNKITTAISPLYGFSVYIQMRYPHLWLTPYFLLPLSCLVAIWICKGTISSFHDNSQKRKYFFLAMFFSFLNAFTGMYYAFFACVIYAIAIVIRVINVGFKKFGKESYSLFCILSTVLGVFINAIPNLIYWITNGANNESELVIRNMGDAEVYALKLIQLVLPRVGHRIAALNQLSNKYYNNYPLVNENATAALGIVATIGLVASIIWLLGKCKEDEKVYSSLVIGLILVGTMGGISSLFSLIIKTPMRCYNRISIMIMFLCLICVTAILEKIKKKVSPKTFPFILFAVLLIGIYDQTAYYGRPAAQYAELDSIQNFIHQIESQEDDDTLIFQLPYVNWPSGGSYRMFAGYLESDHLRWSFGSMQGRQEALWQQNVAGSDIDTLIQTLLSSGYGGIYLDSAVYAQQTSQEAAVNLCNTLTEKLQTAPIISENGELYFWKIK